MHSPAAYMQDLLSLLIESICCKANFELQLDTAFGKALPTVKLSVVQNGAEP